MQYVGEKRKLKINKSDFVSTLIAFYIVFFSDSFFCTTMVQEVYEEIFQWSLVVASGLIFLRLIYVNRKIGKDFFTLIFVILTMIVSMLVNSSPTGVYFYKIAVLLFGFCYSKMYSLEQFSYYFKKIMTFLMVISLVFYVWYIIGLPVSFLPTVVNNKGNAQYSILFATLPVIRTGFIRIKGPFWEPGVYASYLSMTLYFSLIIEKKKDFRYIGLILISLILTFSTTGYTTALLIAAGYIFDSSNNASKSTKIAVVIGLIISIFLVISSDRLYGFVFGKIDNSTESMRNRWNVISGNIEAIKQYPIFGAGPTKSTDIIISNMKSLGSRWSFSNLNTILAHYSVFGVFCALYFVYYILRFVRQTTLGFLSKILLLSSIIVQLSCFGFQFSLFFGIIFMLVINEKRIV